MSALPSLSWKPELTADELHDSLSSSVDRRNRRIFQITNHSRHAAHFTSFNNRTLNMARCFP
ncbi:hypothetical protein NQ318_020042 [Aromia moschata]|uniref:Uncharacterized protein n=1 Tax=Aromia moschata TaxID=1265417 RepID=A0AAV8Z970_9CUCU|nr:hypothetical protein NQ318_020042 [Aromia moschata]